MRSNSQQIVSESSTKQRVTSYYYYAVFNILLCNCKVSRDVQVYVARYLKLFAKVTSSRSAI